MMRLIKRIVIAGSRYYENYSEAKKFIDYCISDIKNKYKLIILSGGCKGADLIGERYARESGYGIERFLPEWDKYGKSVGLRRNKTMAQRCDYVICFWDGKSKGRKTMIKYAKELNKPIRIKCIDNK